MDLTVAAGFAVPAALVLLKEAKSPVQLLLTPVLLIALVSPWPGGEGGPAPPS